MSPSLLPQLRTPEQLLEARRSVDRLVHGAGDVEALLEAVLSEVLELFDCDRAWLLHPLDLRAPSWQVRMERTRPQWPGAHALGVPIAATDESAQIFATALAAPGAVSMYFSAPDAETSLSKRFDIQAQLIQAVRPRVGDPWLLGLHHCARPHTFPDDEIALFEAIATRIEVGLTQLLSLRQLHETDQRFRELMGSIEEVIWSAAANHDTI